VPRPKHRNRPRNQPPRPEPEKNLKHFKARSPERAFLFKFRTSNIQRPTSNIESNFGVRREAKRHAAFTTFGGPPKRCRRCALPPQSKRWRDCRASSNFAKRLECERFTAAFSTPTGLSLVFSLPQPEEQHPNHNQ
jgi:hypothetical protein